MADYRLLLKLLQKELGKQEKLLELLTKERVAIVKLNQEQLNELRTQKERIFSEAREVEVERSSVIAELSLSWNNNAGRADKKTPIKFSEIIEHCPDNQTKRELKKVGEDLKAAASNTQELNEHNSQLIKQTLGIIATTISIMRSTPATGLPSYGSTGQLTGEDDKNFIRRSGAVSREA